MLVGNLTANTSDTVVSFLKTDTQYAEIYENWDFKPTKYIKHTILYWREHDFYFCTIDNRSGSGEN